ncbi:MAG: N-acetyltransferase family protein [Paracoccaceae bacterium]
MALTIRPARDADMAQVAAIWAPILEGSTVTFANDPRPPEVLCAMAADRRAKGHEFFVAGDGDRVLGFATYSQFRAGNGYLTSMEHTVILAPDAKGRGVGRRLLAAVEDHARAGGAHAMVAVVSGENREGVAFHAACGYRDCGTLPEVGRKFGRYLDAVMMVKLL